MGENEQSSQTLNTIYRNSSASNEVVFHAVYIPETNIDSSAENNTKENIRVYQDKAQALKVIKEFKTGRLKSFKKRSEAEEYAKTGFEKTNYINNTLIPATVPVEEKSNNFKAPRSQDLVSFRKLIKSGDLRSVRDTAWGNPRYLIGSGDTPAILQEGCRYNALHVAVRAQRADMCELILSIVGNTDFINLFYGDECKSYVDRAQIMLDLYLNTPDKGLNETPLHFAAKYGLKDVVRVLISYPCCIKTLPNKYKQLPIDIICTRTNQEDEELKREIRLLLEDQYYVPVLRSDDNSSQPVIGEPFSPKTSSPLNISVDPMSPRFEVRAFAGPMTKSQALEFRKKWKTPPRLRMTPIAKSADEQSKATNSPINSSLRLQDPEKGLERVGRDLAEEYQVSWKEYWPFLNDFADFRTAEGLLKLEKYLERTFQDQLIRYKQKLNDKMTNSKKNSKMQETDGINHLSNKLECSLCIINKQDQNNIDELEFFTPPSSPKLAVDSSDDEMQSAEEGHAIFLGGPAPTKLDYAVFNAVSTSVDATIYPNIYLWQHDMQLATKCDSQRENDLRSIRKKLIMDF